MTPIPARVYFALGVALTLVCIEAVPVEIHNTGEGLVQGQLDANWSVIMPDGTAFGSAISATDPGNQWVTPTSPNTWISTVARGSSPLGLYQYSTTFTIDPGLDPLSAILTGNWWADEPNTPNAILLNGVLVSDFNGAIWFESNPANAAFTVSSGFVSGLNTLTFLVQNTGGPGGTLIQNLSLNANAVPEAGSSLTLLGLALGSLYLFRSHKNALQTR
jgi:hypothetical protein